MMKAIEIAVPKKNELTTMADEDLVFYYERIVALEKAIKEMKNMIREELIRRYGIPATHVVGDYKLVIDEREKTILDTKAVKKFLTEIGKYDEFTKKVRYVYIYVK